MSSFSFPRVGDVAEFKVPLVVIFFQREDPSPLSSSFHSGEVSEVRPWMMGPSPALLGVRVSQLSPRALALTGTDPLPEPGTHASFQRVSSRSRCFQWYFSGNLCHLCVLSGESFRKTREA